MFKVKLTLKGFHHLVDCEKRDCGHIPGWRIRNVEYHMKKVDANGYFPFFDQDVFDSYFGKFTNDELKTFVVETK